MVPEQVRAVGQFVSGIAGNLRSGLGSANTEIDGLRADGWRGDAADEFFAGWAQLCDGGQKILQALDGMAAQLGAQAGDYEATDDGTSQRFSSVKL